MPRELRASGSRQSAAPSPRVRPNGGERVPVNPAAPPRVRPHPVPARSSWLAASMAPGGSARTHSRPARPPQKSRESLPSHSDKSRFPLRLSLPASPPPQTARGRRGRPGERPEPGVRTWRPVPRRSGPRPPFRASCPIASPSLGSGLHRKSLAPQLPPRTTSRGRPEEGRWRKGRSARVARPTTHLDLKVGQAERSAKERTEVCDGRDFPPGTELAQPGRAALLRAHLLVAAPAPGSARAPAAPAARARLPCLGLPPRRGASAARTAVARRRLLLPRLPLLGVSMSRRRAAGRGAAARGRLTEAAAARAADRARALAPSRGCGCGRPQSHTI